MVRTARGCPRAAWRRHRWRASPPTSRSSRSRRERLGASTIRGSRSSANPPRRRSPVAGRTRRQPFSARSGSSWGPRRSPRARPRASPRQRPTWWATARSPGPPQPRRRPLKALRARWRPLGWSRVPRRRTGSPRSLRRVPSPLGRPVRMPRTPRTPRTSRRRLMPLMRRRPVRLIRRRSRRARPPGPGVTPPSPGRAMRGCVRRLPPG